MLFRPGLVGRMPCPQDWYQSSGTPTIDNDFSSAVLPGGWVFTRASVATDSTWQDNPNQQTYNNIAINQPLINQWGLKVEPATTNLFLNSDAPVTQTITLPVAGQHAVWMVGPGSVAVTAGTGSFSGLGTATNGAPVLLNSFANGNSIVCTITGTVYRVQVEKQNGPTSYIPSGASAATRAESRLQANFPSGRLNRLNGTYWVEFFANHPNPGCRIFTAGAASYTQDNETDQLILFGNLSVPSYFSQFNVFTPAATGAGNTAPSQNLATGKVLRIACTYDPQRIAMCADYGAVLDSTITGRPAALTAVTLGGGGSAAAPTQTLNGYIRGFRYWPSTMTDSELHECTGAGYYAGKPVFDLDGTQANQWRMWTFTRGATTGVTTDALMSDPAGTSYTTYGGAFPGAGASPRFTSRGLLLDSTHSNYMPNSTSPAASGVTGTLPAQAILFSMRGSGSVALTANTVVAAGLPATVTQNNPVLVTVTTAGTANFVCTGTVEMFQAEQAGAPGNFFENGPKVVIRTTAASQTSGAEGISLPCGPWFSGTAGMYVMDFTLNARQSGTYFFSVDDGTANNREQLFATNSNLGIGGGWGFNTIYRGFNPGRIDMDNSQIPWALGTHRLVLAVSSDRKRQCAMDGVLGMTGALSQGGDDGGPPRPTGTLTMKIGMNQGGNTPPQIYVRRWRYYDYAVFDADLIALTQYPTDLEFNFMSGVLDSRLVYTRATTATYVDNTGTIRVSPTNTARFDCDPVTGALRGLLCEEQRTNSYFPSNNMASMSVNASPNDVLLTANVATPLAPDGTASAARHVPSASQGSHIAYKSITLVASTAYVWSAFVKAAGYNFVNLQMAGAGYPVAASAVFDLANGIVVSQGAGLTAAGIIPYPNGWYRCWISATSTGTACLHYVAAFPTSATNNFTGDGASGIHVWGGQVEAGAFPTSYIPTTAIAVTRNADAANILTSPAWYNAVAGTLVGEAYMLYSGLSNNPVIASIDDNSINNVISVRGSINLGSGVIASNPAALNINTINTYSANSVIKVGLAYSASNQSVCLNGGPVATGVPVGIPTVNQLRLGNGRNASLNSHVRRVRYWGRTLSDTDLQAVTA